jgi:hypothetical protein
MALAALGASCAGHAGAAEVTRTYTAVSVFDQGPFSEVTQTFTLTFDPTVYVNGLTVTGYSVDNNSPVFNQSILAEIEPDIGGLLVFYAPPAGDAVAYNEPDFYTQFYVDNNGVATSYPNILYSLGTGGSGVYGSPYFEGTVTTSGVGVPEPAAWTLMICGFGLLGAAIRGRRGRLAAA